MERVRFIEHRGHRVLLLDYSGLREERDTLEMIEERTEVVSGQSLGSVLTLADLTGAHFSRAALQRIKEANVLDYPFVRRAALVAAETATPKGLVDSVGTFASKQWGQFATREEALEWLVEDSQQPPATQG